MIRAPEVLVGVPVRAADLAPRPVADRPLDDYAHSRGARGSENLYSGALVHQAEARLKRVEHTAPDSPQGSLVVAAVPDEPGLTLVASADQRLDHLSPLQHFQIAGVELQDVQVVGPEPSEAAFDALGYHLSRPRLGLRIDGMTALGRQEEVVSAMRGDGPYQRLR